MSAIPHQETSLLHTTEPSPAAPPRRRPLTALLAASPIAVAIPLATTGALLTIDMGVAEWGAGLVPGWFVASMRSVTHLGGGEILYPIAAATAVLAYRRRDMQAMSFLALAVVGQSVLSNGLKVLFSRSRPDLSQLAGWTGWSFPSGHTLAAAAVLMAIALTIGRWRSPTARFALASLAVTLAVAVALSRVVLGVHWVSDVMAGLFFGWLWVAVSYRLAGRFAPTRSYRPAATG